jgi:hypothetical protein
MDPVAALCAARFVLQAMLFRHGARSHHSELLRNLALPTQPQTNHVQIACVAACSVWSLKRSRSRSVHNGTFGPHAIAVWPHHRLRILSRHRFRSFCLALTCRRWYEHAPPSSSLPRAYFRPLDNSELKPTRCLHDPYAVFAATRPLSQRSACFHQSLRAMVAHAVTGTQRLQSVFPGLRDTLPTVLSRLSTVDSETPCRRAAKQSPHCATTVSMRRLSG